MLKNLKLATKMLMSFGFVAAIALFLGLFGYYGAVRSEQSIDEIGMVRLPSVENLLIIKENANAVKTVQRTLLNIGIDRAERQRQYDNLDKIREAYETAWKNFEPLPQTPEETELWSQFVPAWQEWRAANNVFFDMIRQLDSLDLGNPLELTKNLQIFIGDNLKLEGDILKLINDGEPFAGGDKHEGNYGKWFASFKTSNSEIQQMLREVAAPHGRTHESIKQINELVSSGITEEARDVYRTLFVPNIKDTLEIFYQILKQGESALELFHKAEHNAMNEVQTSGDKATDLLDRIIKIHSDAAALEVKTAHRFASRLEFALLAAAVAGTVLAFIIAIMITRAITRPLGTAVNISKELSQGNLTLDIQVDSKDETGQLLAAMKNMTENLRAMFGDIANGVATLSSSSTELSAISTQLSSNAEDAAARSTGVASAAEELSTNMSSVSAAMEQSASNVGMVASASEEMSSTVREIARNAAKAKDISEQAVDQSQKTSTKINELGQAANKIGKVTEAITEISEQTNLLALNATIEAARAGEAGKGFAVVANEIKELARQTAGATVDIKNQIEEMQLTTGGTITDIEHIARVINEINEIITTIATAVEQQSATTSEISENISQAAAGIAEVNENVAQSSIAIGDITTDIGGISSSSEEVNQGSHNVKESATDLSKLAEQLDGLVRRFKLS